MIKICQLVPGDHVSLDVMSAGFLIRLDTSFVDQAFLFDILERVNTEKKDTGPIITLLCLSILMRELHRIFKKLPLSAEIDASLFENLSDRFGHMASAMTDQLPDLQ